VADYEFPEDLRYSKDDEWARPEAARVVVGITDYAQKQLGDIVYVELPVVGTTLHQGDVFGVVESVKAVSDLYAPVSGEVVEINPDLGSRPETVNEDCYGDGWMIALAVDDPAEVDDLLDAAAYARHVEERGE
jgi:glycine cleavage system H protein